MKKIIKGKVLMSFFKESGVPTVIFKTSKGGIKYTGPLAIHEEIMFKKAIKELTIKELEERINKMIDCKYRGGQIINGETEP